MSSIINLLNINLEENDDESYMIVENDMNRKLVTDYISDNNIIIKRGDIINTIEDGYRNDGVLIWDGNEALWLDYEIDEYGSVPKQFIIGPDTFTPDYWSSTICHNNIYWPCEKYRQEVSESLVFDKEISDEEHWHGVFTHDDKIYIVFVDDEYNEDYEYDPKLNTNIMSCIGGKMYRGKPHEDRKSRDEFVAAVLDMNIPFNTISICEYNDGCDDEDDEDVIISNIIF